MVRQTAAVSSQPRAPALTPAIMERIVWPWRRNCSTHITNKLIYFFICGEKSTNFDPVLLHYTNLLVSKDTESFLVIVYVRHNHDGCIVMNVFVTLVCLC